MSLQGVERRSNPSFFKFALSGEKMKTGAGGKPVINNSLFPLDCFASLAMTEKMKVSKWHCIKIKFAISEEN